MITDVDLDQNELWERVQDALMGTPCQGTYEACVAVTVAQRLTGYIDADQHAADLKFIARHWPPKENPT